CAVLLRLVPASPGRPPLDAADAKRVGPVAAPVEDADDRAGLLCGPELEPVAFGEVDLDRLLVHPRVLDLDDRAPLGRVLVALLLPAADRGHDRLVVGART